MALDRKVDTFTLQNTDSGTKVITGTGFTPKLLLFYCAETASVTTIAATLELIIGAATSSSNQYSVNQTAQNGQPSSNTKSRGDNGSCIVGMLTSSGAVEFDYSLNSMDSNGFTLDVNTACPSDKQIGYIALGGSDLANVIVGSENSGTATGLKHITGLSFEPNTLMCVGTTLNPNNVNDNLTSCVSFVDSSGNQGCIALQDNDAAANTACDRKMLNDEVFVQLNSTGGTYGEGHFTSYNSDGWTWNRTTAFASSFYIFYVAMEVTDSAVGEVTLNNSISTITETGLSFQPRALFTMSAFASTYGAQAGISACYGFTDGTNQWMIGASSEDGQPSSDTDKYSSAAALVERYDFAQVKQSSASFGSFTSDGFTLSQDNAESDSTKKVFYLALGGFDVPSERSKKIHLQTDTTYIDSGLDNDVYPCIITEKQVDATFWANVQNGGGDLIATTDEAGTNRVPIDVVTCDTTAEKLEVHTYMQIHSSTVKDLYLWYDSSGTSSQPAVGSAYGRNAVWADYKLVHHSANSLIDSSGNGNDGTNNGSTNITSGKIGDARDFEESSAQDYSVAYDASLDLSAYSVEMWTNLESKGAAPARGLLGTRFGTIPNNYFDFKWDNNDLRMDVGNGAAWIAIGISATVTPALATWYHVAATIQANDYEMFVNGSSVQTDTTTGTPKLIESGRTLHIGNAYNLEYFDGKIDEIRIAGSVLSDAWLKLSYYSQNDSDNLWNVVTDDIIGHKHMTRGLNRSLNRGLA